jgi:hypothetical protein
LSFTENGGATAIDGSLSVADKDDTRLKSATITMSSGYVSSEDVLGFSTQNGINGTWNSGSGVMILSGSDFDTVIGVYTASGSSFGSLQEVACDNDSGRDGQDSSVTFAATADALYYIAIDGVGGMTGNVQVSYDLDVGFELTKPIFQNESLAFDVQIVPNVPFVIEISDDFINWNVLMRASSLDGAFKFIDDEVLAGSLRFYRVYLAA